MSSTLRTVGCLLGASTLVLHHEVTGSLLGLTPGICDDEEEACNNHHRDLGRSWQTEFIPADPKPFSQRTALFTYRRNLWVHSNRRTPRYKSAWIWILKGGVLLALEPRLPISCRELNHSPPVVESVFVP